VEEEQIYESLKKILNENYDVPIEEITPEFTLRPTLDSIDFLNFILEVKILYDLDGNEDVFLHLETLQDVVKLVKSSFQ